MKETKTFVSIVYSPLKLSHFILSIFCLTALLPVWGCVPRERQGPTVTPAPQADRVYESWQKRFRWPEGKRAAISLTFDDARLTQVDLGIPVLDSHGVKATFYVSPRNVTERLDGWRKAVANGHEIGNHTMSHPCTGNFMWSREKALEGYTLEAMAYELEEANASIFQMLKVRPTTFAYPCGQKFVGRGANVRSYVPLVAERFVVGRGAFDEVGNDPAFCDLAHLAGIQMDGLNYGQIIELVDNAIEEGRWLVFFGHDIGAAEYQTTGALALDELCQYALDPGNGLWIDTVQAVGQYILEQRAEKRY
ncbi:MAG: polysaccharide deacetylase family protein [Phycisphaerales bacterium]|nr:MAG: polysaccharide deacetylase family protein [Phycisphaerales bacterium]